MSNNVVMMNDIKFFFFRFIMLLFFSLYFIPLPFLYLFNFLILLTIFLHPLYCLIYRRKLSWWDWTVFTVFIVWNLINYITATFYYFSPPFTKNLSWGNNWPQLIIPFLNIAIVGTFISLYFLRKNCKT